MSELFLLAQRVYPNASAPTGGDLSAATLLQHVRLIRATDTLGPRQAVEDPTKAIAFGIADAIGEHVLEITHDGFVYCHTALGGRVLVASES